jgi:hypothetical protein
MIRQANCACEQCGSWYRNGDNCNICKTHQPVPQSFYAGSDNEFSLAGKQSKGRQWDKKKHKYVK